MQSSVSPVFRGVYLSTATGFVSSITSGQIRMTGNKAVLAAMVWNISGSATLTLAIDSSYDGQAWKELTTTTATAFGYTTLAQTAIDAAFVRVRLSLAGTTVNVIVDVSLDTSAQ